MEASPAYIQQRYSIHRSQYILFKIGAICIGLGLGLILSAPTSPEVYLRYDNICAFDPTKATTTAAYDAACKLTFTIDEPLTAPVYFYYGFKGFYQNHRRYLKYFSNSQLTTGDRYASTVTILLYRRRMIVEITIQVIKLSEVEDPNQHIPVELSLECTNY